MNKLANF